MTAIDKPIRPQPSICQARCLFAVLPMPGQAPLLAAHAQVMLAMVLLLVTLSAFQDDQEDV